MLGRSAFASGALFFWLAFAQEVTAPQPFTFPVDRSQRMTPATGAPYSADEIHEFQRAAPDGTMTAEPPLVLHVYRDSQGRIRKDHPVPGSELAIVEIQDPVARCEYFLDPQKRVAHRLKPPVIEIDAPHKVTPKTTPANTGTASSPLPSGIEALGTQTIEGIKAEGTRMTITSSSASRRRRRKTSTSTVEVWMSPELEVRVLSKSSSDGMGDATMKLVHINRSEPDAALFKVPAGYKIVDESDSFSITISRP